MKASFGRIVGRQDTLGNQDLKRGDNVNRKRRIAFPLWMLVGLTFVAMTALVSTALLRHQRNMRLAEAVMNGREVRVQALLEEGADPNAPCYSPPFSLFDIPQIVFYSSRSRSHGSTIVMCAAYHPNARILRELLEAGGDVRARTDQGVTALGFAMSAGQHQNVELLVQHGAEVNSSAPQSTPLIDAITNRRHPADFAYLLAHGADPNLQDRNGFAPLNYAAGVGSAECTRALLQAGAHVNAAGFQGRTALLSAAEKGHTEVITLLLTAGADTTLRDPNGKTAEDLAVANAHKPAAQLLHNYPPHGITR